jgi:hypothetical protein
MDTEINDHFSKMEADLLKSREESEAFYKDFSQRQNQHFNAVDNFALRQKRAP